jgi:hypothetical protein
MLKAGLTFTMIGSTAILAMLALGASRPGYALEAYNSHTGDVHVMDTGLSYSDCVDAVDDRRAVWGTAIVWSCEYYR